MTPNTPITRSTALTIAGAALVDPRTVRRYVAGCPVRALAVERIEKALHQLGMTDLVRPTEPVR